MINLKFLNSLFNFIHISNDSNNFKININKLLLEFANEGTTYYLPSTNFLLNLINNQLFIKNKKYFQTSILASEIHSKSNPLYLNNNLEIISYFILTINIIPIILFNINNHFYKNNIKFKIKFDISKKDELIINIINNIIPILNYDIINLTKYFLMLKSFDELHYVKDSKLNDIYQDTFEILILLISLNITIGHKNFLNIINEDLFEDSELKNIYLDKLNTFLHNNKLFEEIDDIFNKYHISKIFSLIEKKFN